MNRIYNFVLLGSLLFLSYCSQPADVEENNEVHKSESVSVEVLPISLQNTRRFLEFSGLIQPSSVIEVFPEAAGKITEIIVAEGSWVSNDEILARIDQTDYKLGLAQAQAARQLAEASLNNAENTLARQLELKNEGFSSEAVLEGAQTAYDIAAAQFEQARVAVQLAKRQLDRTKIKAPVAGYVSFKGIDQGQFVSAGNPAYIIQNLKKMVINLTLNENQIMYVNENSLVAIESDFLRGKRIRGNLVFAGKSVDSAGGYPVKIEIENENLKLKAGWTVSCKIYQPKPEDVVMVPGRAIINSSGRWTAFVVENEQAHERDITLENQIADRVIISAGLSANESLIVRGQEYCKSGEPVEIIKTWSSLDDLLKSE